MKYETRKTRLQVQARRRWLWLSAGSSLNNTTHHTILKTIPSLLAVIAATFLAGCTKTSSHPDTAGIAAAESSEVMATVERLYSLANTYGRLFKELLQWLVA